MTQGIVIAAAGEEDEAQLAEIRRQQGGAIAVDYFRRSFQEQAVNKRRILVAQKDGAIVGYVQLVWQPGYRPFQLQAIPEIQDLNVLPAFRRQGIGEALVRHCEDLARDWGAEYMGIGVGLTRDYGQAQRLYVRLGYLPDGLGVVYDETPVRHGEIRPVDDDLCLKLLKSLSA